MRSAIVNSGSDKEPYRNDFVICVEKLDARVLESSLGQEKSLDTTEAFVWIVVRLSAGNRA